MTKAQDRRYARELVLMALYARECSGEPCNKIITDLKNTFEIETDVEDYVKKLFTITVEHQSWATDEIISRLENWDYERIALIDRLVLQIMIVEMQYMKNVPPKVSITEGVEIAKKYSTAESGGFVNGILDSFYHSLSNQKGNNK
tara:strand:+ start:527 stop:961 length:435 start_codon:yes stop_codon:yes gene_type:complete